MNVNSGYANCGTNTRAALYRFARWASAGAPKQIVSLLLMNLIFLCPALADFTNITDLDGFVIEGGVIRLEWSVNQISNESPSNYIYEFQRSKTGTFQSTDVTFENWTAQVYDGQSVGGYRTRYDVGGLTSGDWRFRMRILHKPGEPGDEVTGWSNIELVTLEAGLAAPELILHDFGTGIVRGHTISLTVATTATIVDLHYGRTQDVINNPEFIEPNINKTLHTVDLSKRFSSQDRVFFRARVMDSRDGEGLWSDIEIVIYDPSSLFSYYVPHVTATDATETHLYIWNPGDKGGDITFKAVIGGGVFGPFEPQSSSTWLAPGMAFNLDAALLFPGLHRRPIIIESETPLEISISYRTEYGTTNIGSVPAATAGKSLRISGLHCTETVRPGLAVSNVTATNSVVTFYVASVSNEILDPAQTLTTPAVITVPAYSSSVLMLDEYLAHLPDRFAGTLFIESTTDVSALGVLASQHSGFQTLHYLTGRTP